jgi:hypothetical protein
MKHRIRLDRIEKQVDEMHGSTDAPICSLIRAEYDQDFKGNSKQAILKLTDFIRSETPTVDREPPE